AYLRNHGLSAPCPIQDVNQHHLTTWQSKPAALFDQLPGQSILQPELEHCRQIGKALAQLHLIGQQFPLQRNNEWGFHWAQHTGKRFINTFIGTSESTQLNQDDKQLLSDELLFQKEFQQSIQEDSLHQPLPQGIIHADLFCDNVLFDNNQLSGILDFYTACNGYLLYDLAITVNAWCIGTDNYLDPTKAKTMIEAYEQLRPLTQNEQHHWSTLLRAAGLRFWLSRLLYQDSRKEAELTQDKDPDVLKCLLLKHRENVTFCQSLCFK
ncbi:MAG: phosphotransferase, partial [Gammaproteobacteria bacterium]|nr:phosphotransferase [Gammaproteobacteria bacterium]